MMGPGFVDAIARQMIPAIVVAVLVLVAFIVCVFFLGRCSAQHHIQLQSPIKVQEAPHAEQ